MVQVDQGTYDAIVGMRDAVGNEHLAHVAAVQQAEQDRDAALLRREYLDAVVAGLEVETTP